MFKKVLTAVAFTAPALAFAALPAGVDTSITGVTTDGTTLIGLLAAAGAALWLISKVLRKFGVML